MMPAVGTRSARAILILAFLLHASTEEARAQRSTTFITSHPHHGGQTVILGTATLAGAVGLAALVNLEAGDSGWQKAGTVSFAVAGATLGTGAALLLAVAGGFAVMQSPGAGLPDGPVRAILTVGLGTAGGVLLGRAGHRVGTRAREGSGSARRGVMAMSAAAAPLAILLFGAQYLVTDW